MNAKQELLQRVKDRDIKCAVIKYDKYDDEDAVRFILKVNHDDQEFQSFLNSLDFEYDHGYGIQHLFGTVWLKDGTWLQRGEYDGSEWWDHRIYPTIPKECE